MSSLFAKQVKTNTRFVSVKFLIVHTTYVPLFKFIPRIQQ